METEIIITEQPKFLRHCWSQSQLQYLPGERFILNKHLQAFLAQVKKAEHWRYRMWMHQFVQASCRISIHSVILFVTTRPELIFPFARELYKLNMIPEALNVLCMTHFHCFLVFQNPPTCTSFILAPHWCPSVWTPAVLGVNWTGLGLNFCLLLYFLVHTHM